METKNNKTMTTLDQYIYDKINDGSDKRIKFSDILPWLKKFWSDWYYSHEGKKSLEDYFKGEIEAGYISEDGTPLKCECGCTDFEQVNQTYGEGWIEEYSWKCTNDKCLKIVGHWAYGNWQV